MSSPLTIHEPTGSPTGAVVVVQEAFGVNAYIDDVMRRLAQHGWLTVAPHLYHRAGVARVDDDDILLARALMADLTAERILADVDGALDCAAERGFGAERIGLIGFCMGGTVSLAAAARRDVGAAVSFYGAGLAEGRFGFQPLIDEARTLRAPWLGIFGDRDVQIPLTDVEVLRGAAASSGQVTEVVRYADAEHGFHCDRRRSYHPEHARDAWARALDWFRAHLRGGTGLA